MMSFSVVLSTACVVLVDLKSSYAYMLVLIICTVNRLSFQMKILEADLNKHYSASKSLQSQIRKAGAEIKTYEIETKRVAEENQVCYLCLVSN